MEGLWRTTFSWPDRDDGPLEVWVTTALVEGRPVPIGVEVWSVRPDELPSWLTGLQPKQAKAHWPIWGRKKRPVRGILTEDLRLPLQKLMGEIVAKNRKAAQVLDHAANENPTHWANRPSVRQEVGRVLEMTDDSTTQKGRVGRRPLSYAHYAEVAEVYREAVGAGENPLDAIRGHFSKSKNIATRSPSKNTAAKWVWRCRREPYNFLPPTVRGRSRAEEDSNG